MASITHPPLGLLSMIIDNITFIRFQESCDYVVRSGLCLYMHERCKIAA